MCEKYIELAEQHITDSGTTVLGRYPGYIEKAKKMGASYFDIGKEWDEVAKHTDPWELNQYFLENRIAAGDRFVTSVPKGEIEALDPSKYTAREIAFLKEKGYQWVNQWCLKPGG